MKCGTPSAQSRNKIPSVAQRATKEVGDYRWNLPGEPTVERVAIHTRIPVDTVENAFRAAAECETSFSRLVTRALDLYLENCFGITPPRVFRGLP